MDLGASFTGGTGADNFFGSVIDDLATGTTLNPGDSLVGGDGADTLNITLSGNPTSTFVVQTASVETISVGNYDTNTGTDVTLNLAAASNVTNFSVVGGGGDTLTTGLAALATIGGSNSTGNISVTYGSGVLSGTADTQNVTLSSFGLSTDKPTLTVADAASGSNIAETVAFTVTGSNYVTLDAANNSKTISVAGSGNLTVDANADTTITTINASTATGNVAITNIGASKLSMTGGTGNDTLRIDGSTIDADDTVNAGNGTDTLQLTVAANVTSSTSGAQLVGFDKVEGYANANDVSLVVAQDVSLLGSAPTSVGVSSWTRGTAVNGGGDHTATDGVNFSNMAASTSLSLAGVTVTDLDGDDGTIVNFTATADLYTDTIADSIAVTLGTESAAMASVTALDANTAFNLTLSVDDYETVTINSLGDANTIAGLDSSDMTSLVINATKALTITDTTEPASLRTINASGSTADVNTEAFAIDGAATVTGGTGNDKFQGSTAADSIVGGAGNDSLTGAGGNDTVDGGTGNDTIVGGSGNDRVTAGDGDDSVTLDAGKDSVNGGAGNDTFSVSFTNLTTDDTLVGGEGTDTVAFSDTGSVALTTANSLKFTNLSSIDKYSFASLTGDDDTVSVDDTVVGLAANALTLSSSSNSETTWDMSGVLSNSSKVTLTFTSAVTDAQTYKIGNGIDVATLTTSSNDEIVVTTNAYLGSSDTISGGAGTLDTMIFTSATGATVTTNYANVTGVERIQISDASGAGSADYVVTLTDTILANNYDSSGALYTVSRNDNDSNSGDTTKADATNVSSSYNLWLDGAGGNDTLIGGAGNDTVVATTGVDSLTGGAGNDTYVIAAGSTSGVDSLVGVSFGTSTTAVDTINLSYVLDRAITVANMSGLTGDATDTAANVVILDETAYATLTDASNAASDDADLTYDGAAVLVWQDTLGVTHISMTSDVDGGAGTDTDLAKLSGLTVADIATILTSADLSVAGLTLQGSSEAETITGGIGNDTINARGGADSIVGGQGADTISLTETTSVADTVVFEAVSGIEVDTISGFVVATDKAKIVATDTSDTTDTANANAVITTITTALSTAGNAWSIAGSIVSHDLDVVELNLAVDTDVTFTADSTGADLFEALSSDAGAISGITIDNADSAEDDKFYLITYQNSNAYLWHLVADGVDTTANVASGGATLVGVINGVALGGFATGDIILG